MRLMAALIGGVIAGCIGAAIWVGISYLTHFEIAWIAWVVGVLVGLGVRLGADRWEGFAPGAVAVLLALATIVAGKFIAAETILPLPVNLSPTAADVKKTMARLLITDAMNQRVQLSWPKGNSRRQIESQLARDIYPESIVAEVEKQWSGMKEDEQKAMIQKEKERIDTVIREFNNDTRQNFFQNNFRIVDAIFYVLAAITAYRIGSGSLSNRRFR